MTDSVKGDLAPTSTPTLSLTGARAAAMERLLLTVRDGIARGYIKSAPLMDDNPNALSLQMRTLTELIDEVLAIGQGTPPENEEAK